MEEIWKPVLGYEGFYEVSSMGLIRSIDRITPNPKGGKRKLLGKLRKLGKHSFGYPTVGLYARGSFKMVSVHTLILEAFVGPRQNGDHACHNDGNPSNTCLSNLRWDTAHGNHADKRTHGTHQEGERNPASKICVADVVAIRAAKGLHRDIAKKYGLARTTVSAIKRGRLWPSVP